MTNIKAVGLGTLAKRLCLYRKGWPLLREDYDLMVEIQRRLNFMKKHGNRCDCPLSDECVHIDVIGNCLVKDRP